jgi:acyl-CoA synthetase (AMP-forming)/AMP-acid ligase II
VRIADFFASGARLYPDSPAFADSTGRLSYAEAAREAGRIGAAIRGNGYAKAAHVGILAPNCNAAFVGLLGLFQAEAVWLPINPRNPVAVNAELLAQFDCELLFYHGQYGAEAAQLRATVPVIREIVRLDGADGVGTPLAKWMAGQPESLEIGPAEPNDLFGIFPTGGTTGKSKGVMISNRNVECMFANMWAHFRYAGHSNHLVVAPMTHTAGLLGCLHFARGGCNTILPGADIPSILETIERTRVTHLFLPPTVMYMMLAHPDVDRYDYSSLQHFILGAAPTSLQKLKRAIEIFGPVMTECYGQTEAPVTVTMKAPWDCLDAQGLMVESRLASVGRPGVFNQVAIIDDDGNELPRGESGEICIRGDLVTPGYYKNAEATREVRTYGWHHTGDVGVMDTEGFIRIVDRKKDMVISGGFNVFPNEIEQVLTQHPAVHECAVIGVPDEKWGEAVNAFVILKRDTVVKEEVLIALVKEKLGGVKAPKRVHFVEDLPRSPVGKVLKSEIRKAFRAGPTQVIA